MSGIVGRLPRIGASARRPVAVPALEIISSGVVTNQPSLPITDLSAIYRAYKLVFDNLAPVGDDVNFVCRLSTNNGSSYFSTSGDYHWGGITGGTSSNSTNGGSILLTSFTGSLLGGAAGEISMGDITIANPMNAAARTMVKLSAIVTLSNGVVLESLGGGRRNNAEANNAIQFFFNSGNIASMDYTLYGLRAA